MRALGFVLGVISLCLIGPPTVHCEEAASPDSVREEPGLSVGEMIFCAGVKDRVPLGVSNTFPADIYSVYCFTSILGATDTTTVFHNWYYGDSRIAGVELTVKSSTWRTWSSKKMMPDWRGEWKVEVTAPDGAVIESKRFHLE